MKIQGSVFLVTGGGSGLGAATARRLVASGGQVVVVDVNVDGGRAITSELGAAAHFVEADVRDEAAIRAAVTEARTRYGALQGAVNCAGVAPAERVLGKTGPHALDSFERAIGINLVGTFNV